MMWQTSEIIGYGIRAVDGSIGSIVDLFFDDRSWTVRWAVIDTDPWLSGRRVLLPPSRLMPPDTAREEFPVDLTREEVKNSPDVAADAPASRQTETSLYDYYGWLPYWEADPGYGPPVGAAWTAAPPAEIAQPTPGPVGDPHLRSTGEVTGYSVRATDGGLGHIEEFLVEDGNWAIRYLVVDTRNWLPGKKVLVAPPWIHEVSWPDRRVRVDLTRRQLEDSPGYDPHVPVDRNYEERLYRSYDRSPY